MPTSGHTTLKDKTRIFDRIEHMLDKLGFRIVREDRQRPWGGFFAIDETQAPDFIRQWFPDVRQDQFAERQKLSPKILIVAPGQRLSWQYHHRRAELWRVLEGPVGVVTSPTDEEGPLQRLEAGQMIELACGQRHRLVGLDDWGVLAEIWQHTDPDRPSDESDIVRVQDDFGRQ